MNTSNHSVLADFLLMKHIAQRHGVTENAVLHALEELPDPVVYLGRFRLWHVTQWLEIDAAMRRRAARRHNRGGGGERTEAA